MVVSLRRPILVVGVGLTCTMGLLDVLQHSALEWGGLVTLGAIAGTLGLRWVQQGRQAPDQPTQTLDRVTIETLVAKIQTQLAQLQSEAATVQLSDPPPFCLADLHAQIPQLLASLNRDVLHLAVVGGQGVGKTALIQRLSSQSNPQLTWEDTPGLFAADQPAEARLPAADLSLFVTAGDLTDSEFQTLKQLLAQGQRTLLVLNKQDQYLPEEQSLILQHLRDRVQGLLQPEDVVAIAAQPAPLKVRQHQNDGTQVERWDHLAPNLQSLTERLSAVLQQERQSLVWARTGRSALALQADVQSALNAVRRSKAMPIIEQFQWMAAATAFATPLPAMDLVATTAINAQMVLDLGAIYQQKFSLQQAQTLATTLGSLLLKLGLVELSTQMIGNVLKSNLLTFVAGGFVQGASAAYLTRLAGLSLIESFQEAGSENGTNLDALVQLVRDRLSSKLQYLFQQTQQGAFWQGFVQQALERLTPQAPVPQLAAATAVPLVLDPSGVSLDENTSINLASKSLESVPLSST